MHTLIQSAVAFGMARTALDRAPEAVSYVPAKKAFGALVKADPALAKREMGELDVKAKKKVIEWLKHPAEAGREVTTEEFQAAYKAFAAAFQALKPVESYQEYRIAKKEFKIEVKAFLTAGKTVEEIQAAIKEANPDISGKVLNKVGYYHYKMTH